MSDEITDSAKDCGMTHFHDADIKKALVEISPNTKEQIEAAKYGEITTR